jgi:4-hydroxybenzoate polyprenyltransferase
MLLKAACRLLMIEQVVFSLSWSLAAMMLAWDYRSSDGWLRVVLALLGVVLARTAGMSLNRWIDRHIDTLNPRTASRPLQTGQIKLYQVVVLSLANLALLFMIAASLGWVFVLLYPFVMGLLILYSYAKRFTWACHLILGVIYALGPILSYLVVSDRMDLPALLLGASSGFSIIAADLIYSMQDMQHDRKVGLRSIPARFGFEGARYLSLFFYALSILALGSCGYLVWQTSLFFWLPFALFVALPLWLHKHIQQKEQIYETFFKCSVLTPLVAFLAIAAAKGGV